MLVVKTKLKKIPGKGMGLIVDQKLKKGQIVWRYNALIDIQIKKKDVPKEAKEFFDKYAVDIDKGEELIIDYNTIDVNRVNF